MIRKLMLAVVILCLFVSFLYANEIIFTFEPLESNERLAYQYSRWVLNLYAQDTHSLYVTRHIGSWSLVRWWDNFEFTNNRRDVFFEIDAETRIDPELTERDGGIVRVSTLHHLRGDEGTVTRIFADMVRPSFALSADGRQMLITDYLVGATPPWGHQKKAVFFLYCTETWERLHEFSWAFRAVIGFVDIRRNPDGTFTVRYGGGAPVGGGGAMQLGIFALATFDPISLEFEVLWDRTDWSREDWLSADDFQRVPTVRDFSDDRGYHRFDPTLNLEEVIFAPWITSPAVNPNSPTNEQEQNSSLPIIPVAGILLVIGTAIAIIVRRKKQAINA